MKPPIIALFVALIASAGLLRSAPSEEALRLFTNLQLDQGIDLILKDETVLPPEKEKALKEEFGSTAYRNRTAEFLDAHYSVDELRELNRMFETPLMRRLTKDLVGPAAPLGRHLSTWLLNYQSTRDSLKQQVDHP